MTDRRWENIYNGTVSDVQKNYLHQFGWSTRRWYDDFVSLVAPVLPAGYEHAIHPAGVQALGEMHPRSVKGLGWTSNRSNEVLSIRWLSMDVTDRGGICATFGDEHFAFRSNTAEEREPRGFTVAYREYPGGLRSLYTLVIFNAFEALKIDSYE